MTLRQSPLAAHHRALDAQMVDFGGWEMPIAYPTGTIAEHLACRSTAAAFDVSHLGSMRVDGDGALERLQATLTNDLRKIGPGRAQYTHLLDADDASVLDDIIVWWHPRADGEPDVFDVMPNASNTDRVVAALGGVDTTATRAVIAVQGPEARTLVETVFPEAAAVGRFRVAHCSWNGIECIVAGTGYTGEPGVEIAVPAEAAGALWDALLAAGVTPAGLGARDTLRLEAGLPLHGHELGPGITSLQAGLGWVVAWDKPHFVGRRGGTRRARAGRRTAGSSGSPPRGADRPEPDVPSSSTTRWSARSRAATSRPCSDTASRWPSSAPNSKPVTNVVVDVRGKPLPGAIVDCRS